jgi:hypothetical protein
MTKAVIASFSTIGVLTATCWFADSALAQGKKNDAFGTDVASQCAQMTSPQIKDECVRRLRGESQIGSERSWQGGASANSSSQGPPGFATDRGAPAGKGRR